MGRAPGGDENGLDFRRLDQRVTVGIDLGGQLQLGNDVRRLLQVDVGHGNDLAIEQGLAATTDVVLADGAGADDA
ncbi:hypothetical protein D3C87_2071890 [compost metagenome]